MPQGGGGAFRSARFEHGDGLVDVSVAQQEASEARTQCGSAAIAFGVQPQRLQGQKSHSQQIAQIMVEHALHPTIDAIAQPIEIDLRHFSAGNVVTAIDAKQFALQITLPAAWQSATRREPSKYVQQVEVRQTGKFRSAIQKQTIADHRHIKGFAVKRKQVLVAAQEANQVIQTGLFTGWIQQQQLLHTDSVARDGRQANQESERPGATGESGRLHIEQNDFVRGDGLRSGPQRQLQNSAEAKRKIFLEAFAPQLRRSGMPATQRGPFGKCGHFQTKESKPLLCRCSQARRRNSGSR